MHGRNLSAIDGEGCSEESGDAESFHVIFQRVILLPSRANCNALLKQSCINCR
jgi:hypothetical protein